MTTDPQNSSRVQVPREEELAPHDDTPPAAGSINMKDEDEAVHGKPSDLPGKEGIFAKPIPPRGDV